MRGFDRQQFSGSYSLLPGSRKSVQTSYISRERFLYWNSSPAFGALDERQANLESR
jgi:hypothetical protein